MVLPVPPEHQAGGECHHCQRHAPQHQQDDELHLRQASHARLGHHLFYLKEPVLSNGGSLGVIPGGGLVWGHTALAPSSPCPAVRVPGGGVGVGAWTPQGHLAGPAREPWQAEAVEGAGSVEAAAAVGAGLAGAVVKVNGAKASGEAFWADAGEPIDAIQAGGTVGTGAHQAVVHVGLAALACKASQTAAGELGGKAAVVFTQPAILTW